MAQDQIPQLFRCGRNVVGPGLGQFIQAPVAIQHADGAHADLTAAQNIMLPIADHDGAGGIGTVSRGQGGTDNSGLSTGIHIIRRRAEDAGKVAVKPKVGQHLKSQRFQLGGGHIQRFPGGAQRLKAGLDAGIGGVLQPAGFMVIFPEAGNGGADLLRREVAQEDVRQRRAHEK